MNQARSQELCRLFPNLFRRVPIQQDIPFHAFDGFGIECGDGWYNIIYKLSTMLEELILQLPVEEHPLTRVTQIKEKYGSLRVYLDNSTNEMEELISAAESASEHICENCGDPGQGRGGAWVMTLCDACHADSTIHH